MSNEEYFDVDLNEEIQEPKEEYVDVSDSQEALEDNQDDIQQKIMSGEIKESDLIQKQSLNIGLDLSSALVEDEDEEESEDSLYSPDERLRVLADSIIACCLDPSKSIFNYAVDKLTVVSNPRLFRDENYILFSVLYAYRGKLKRITIDEEFLKLFLNRNRDLITRSKAYIDINAYGEIDGSAELGYISGVLKHFTRLCGFDDTTIREFETNFEKYLIEFKAIEASKVFEKAEIILKEGVNLGRKYYFGFEDAQSYVKRQLSEIEGLVDLKAGTGYVTQSELLLNEKETGKTPIKIADFGRLTELNQHLGGIFTSMFYQILAPAKAGKTKLCSRICHTASVIFGTNVTVWAQEGGMDAWSAQQRAIHFDYLYNTGVDITEKKFGISQDVILMNKFPNDELKQLELSSKIDLASNKNYGSIDYIDRPFEVETFIDDIDTSVKENGSQLVIIDYLQLIGTSTGKPERERIAEAYRKLLEYAKKANVAVLTPGQYKQEVLTALASSNDTSNVDMRASGGGSAETIRTPDYNIAMWASTQDLMNNVVKFLSMPCRMNAAFPEVKAHMDLSVCQFISDSAA